MLSDARTVRPTGAPASSWAISSPSMSWVSSPHIATSHSVSTREISAVATISS
ncbi:hypothetical protein HTZ77_40440 [Nonomuraea sp. SMC257]|uniref:Uncharacterized protein n=1 Tax=Nonomuraea montanisoli TaxID=2741721 RepID=A0A7Y6IHC5_9ACTN|nr:hypothetical protein [Nonomuraea montanisoli]NUW37630.1 hypothetical protein [Nonomuraea montanisoli]